MEERSTHIPPEGLLCEPVKWIEQNQACCQLKSTGGSRDARPVPAAAVASSERGNAIMEPGACTEKPSSLNYKRIIFSSSQQIESPDLNSKLFNFAIAEEKSHDESSGEEEKVDTDQRSFKLKQIQN